MHFPSFPKTIKMVEVSLRDGLPNEAQTVPRPTKVHFINQLSASGLTTIGVGHFISTEAGARVSR